MHYEYMMPVGLCSDDHDRADVYVKECDPGENELILVTGNAHITVLFVSAESLVAMAEWLHDIGTQICERQRKKKRT